MSSGWRHYVLLYSMQFLLGHTRTKLFSLHKWKKHNTDYCITANYTNYQNKNQNKRISWKINPNQTNTSRQQTQVLPHQSFSYFPILCVFLYFKHREITPGQMLWFIYNLFLFIAVELTDGRREGKSTIRLTIGCLWIWNTQSSSVKKLYLITYKYCCSCSSTSHWL